MKQLTIVVADDLVEGVVRKLDAAGIEGYLRLGDATGNRFTAPGTVPRTLTWPATVLLVPAVPEAEAEALVEALAAFAADCGPEPCLRVVVQAVERVL